ncbi:hypothetical protein MUO14_16860 [Halobacillus shinanisalinarum]|uniref:Uncharacterized protein n=1 Tax=Halobacillus shinanisalinarum TaxID=2932258 RepID=A0ABY4GWQ0_9BACI|nr:hypothetical protein [Halobacillus shinanisalinarum]UOQ92150.1 hypothetical protein MUO14_16860 [Halobacillus shinanisalinarum]
MAKKSKKSKCKNQKNKTNNYHKQIKNVFVAEGLYSTYTFFTFGKKLFIHSSLNNEQVFEIAEFEHNQQQLREDLSIPMILEVIQLKMQNQLRDCQQYLLPSMKELHEELWEEICRDQEESLSEKEQKMFDVAVRSENDLLDESVELMEEQPLTYNYFGDSVAYSEDDRQWIDYHMSQGNFDAALNIHMAYVKE